MMKRKIKITNTCFDFLFLQQIMASPYIHPQNISLDVQLEWYKIRDLFCGQNGYMRNIPLALEMAAKCKHPDAEWLSSICGTRVQTVEEAERCFRTHSQDARTLCFTWFCNKMRNVADLLPLYHSACRGFPFAQAAFAKRTTDSQKRFKYAQLAVKHGERDGFSVLGDYYDVGIWCHEKSEEKAIANFREAAKLNSEVGILYIGNSFISTDPKRWYWWGLATDRDHEPGVFYFTFQEQVILFLAGANNEKAIFQIGKVLHGKVDDQKIFGFTSKTEGKIPDAQIAISFYEAQLVACRKAVDEWTKVGMRFRVVKDIRKLIGMMIWNTREEALYAHLRK